MELGYAVTFLINQKPFLLVVQKLCMCDCDRAKKKGHGTFESFRFTKEHKCGHNHKYAAKLSTGLHGSRGEKYQRGKLKA